MQAVVTNFQSLEKAKLEVKGLTLLIGESSQGKSAFFRALQAAMTNRFKSGHVRHGEESASVAIRFPEESPDIYKAIRPWSGSTKMALVTESGTVAFDKLSRTIPKQVADFLNLGTLEVGNEIYSLHFHNQFQPPLMLNFSQKKVLEVLSASPALDDYNLLWSTLSTQRTLNRGAFSELDSILSETKTKLSKVKSQLSLLEPLVPKYESLCTNLSYVEETLLSFRRALVLRKQLQSLLSLQTLLLKHKSFVEESQDTFNTVASLTLVCSARDQYKTLLSSTERLQSLLSLKSVYSLSDSKPRLASLLRLQSLLLLSSYDSLQTLKVRLSKYQSLSTLLDKLSSIRTQLITLDSLRSQLSLLSNQHRQIHEYQVMLDNRICPYCGSQIN